MTLRPIHNQTIITDTAQSLQTYLDYSESETVVRPAFDLGHLSEAMKQISEDMQRTEAHANTLEKAAHTARIKAGHLHSILNSYRNLSIPPVRMPTELLIIVFQYCVHADVSGHVLSERATPWTLAQTCKRWRETVLETPSLWTVVRFNSQVMDIRRCHVQALNMLRTWLERSQTLPISCLAMFDDAKPSVFQAGILDLFIAHSDRWDAVDFTFGNQSDLYFRLSAVSRHLPFLYSCRFRVTISPDSLHSGERVLVHLDAPKLKDATLFVLSDTGGAFPEIVPPWSQLEELAWFSGTPRSFLDVAPSLTHLRYCCLNIAQDMNINNVQRFVLPSLCHFDIFGPFQSIVAILNRLSLPALEDLDMDFDELVGEAADYLLISLGRLQVRSRCYLRHLSAPFSLFSSPNAPLLVERISSVDELRILISTEEDAQQAIDNFTGAKMFRSLKTLHLLFREPPDDDPTLFSRMVDVVESRRSLHDSFTQLERLSLDMMRPSSFAEDRISTHLQPFKKLAELQQDGLILLGRVVEHKWCSLYGDAHWNAGDFQRAARRWARFGYSDWLYEEEIAGYLNACHLFYLPAFIH
uniref:Uncharacterized protein n=1 Tax=Moniliophthora roreri TaxID=221103 RepID=A0A0W0G4H0_MONRR